MRKATFLLLLFLSAARLSAARADEPTTAVERFLGKTERATAAPGALARETSAGLATAGSYAFGTAGLALAFLGVWSRYQRKRGPGKESGISIKILGRKILSSKASLVVVDVKGRTLLLGLAGESLLQLADLSDGPSSDVGAGHPSSAAADVIDTHGLRPLRADERRNVFAEMLAAEEVGS